MLELRPSNEWNGVERRMEPHDCSQVDRLKRIEEDVLNHKSWRKDTTKLLEDINIQVATLNERLHNKFEKYDEHVREAGTFRTTLIFTILGFVVSVIAGSIAYGKLQNQVEVNTARWDKLLQSHDPKEIK